MRYPFIQYLASDGVREGLGQYLPDKTVGAINHMRKTTP